MHRLKHGESNQSVYRTGLLRTFLMHGEQGIITK